jgi:hypothetical protein
MKFYPIPHTCYGGIDRQVDGMYCGVLDAEGAVRVPKNRRTNPQAFLQTLTPCRADVVVGVEGLVTWSWLAALGEDDGMPFVQDLATLATRPGQGTARSILAHKRGRAVYCRLKHPVAVDQAKFLAP